MPITAPIYPYTLKSINHPLWNIALCICPSSTAVITVRRIRVNINRQSPTMVARRKATVLTNPRSSRLNLVSIATPQLIASGYTCRPPLFGFSVNDNLMPFATVFTVISTKIHINGRCLNIFVRTISSVTLCSICSWV